MWFLNYCAPFRFISTQQIHTFRFIIYSEVFALFILYLVMIILYRILGETRRQKQMFARQPEETRREFIALKFAPQDYWISMKEFKQWYLNYFTIHAVAATISALYAPYLPQVIFACLHLLFFIVSTILLNFSKKGVPLIIFNITMVICALLNIALLFSGSMGVGASGYDENEKICLLQMQGDTTL